MNLWNLKVHLPWQNMDNNFSKDNKQQNEALTTSLTLRTMSLMQWNEFKIKTQIKYHIIDWEYANNNKLIPELEAKKEAEETFKKYKELGYIDEWNNLREDLVQYIV